MLINIIELLQAVPSWASHTAAWMRSASSLMPMRGTSGMLGNCAGRACAAVGGAELDDAVDVGADVRALVALGVGHAAAGAELAGGVGVDAAGAGVFVLGPASVAGGADVGELAAGSDF
eukprot:9524791-Alexandrium_andersonii.AAC.1